MLIQLYFTRKFKLKLHDFLLVTKNGKSYIFPKYKNYPKLRNISHLECDISFLGSVNNVFTYSNDTDDLLEEFCKKHSYSISSALKRYAKINIVFKSQEDENMFLLKRKLTV